MFKKVEFDINGTLIAALSAESKQIWLVRTKKTSVLGYINLSALPSCCVWILDCNRHSKLLVSLCNGVVVTLDSPDADGFNTAIDNYTSADELLLNCAVQFFCLLLICFFGLSFPRAHPLYFFFCLFNSLLTVKWTIVLIESKEIPFKTYPNACCVQLKIKCLNPFYWTMTLLYFQMIAFQFYQLNMFSILTPFFKKFSFCSVFGFLKQLCDNHQKAITYLSVKNGLILTSSEDGTICLRLLANPSHIAQSFYAHDSWAKGVSCAIFSCDMKYIFSAGMDGSLLMWEIPETLQQNLKATTPLPSILDVNDLTPNHFAESISDESTPTFAQRVSQFIQATKFRQFQPVREEIEKDLQSIRNQYQSLIEKNRQANVNYFFMHCNTLFCNVELQKLSDEDLIVDLTEHEKLEKENAQFIEQMQESIHIENIGKKLITHRIKQQCWDSMEDKVQVIAGITNETLVTTFPILAHKPEEQAQHQKIDFDETEVTANPDIHYLWDINTKERDYTTIGTTIDEFGINKDQSYHPIQLHSNIRKIIQIHFLNKHNRSLMKYFNQEAIQLFKVHFPPFFLLEIRLCANNKIKQQKQQEVEKINEMAFEMSHILKELKITDEAVDFVQMKKIEFTERVFEIVDEENNQQTTQASTTLEVDSKQNKTGDCGPQADTMRALQEMMNGTLECKDEVERLEETIQKPAFMNTIPEASWTEQQKQEMALFLEKKDALEKAKESLFDKKLQIMEDVYIHEWMIIHLVNSIVNYEKCNTQIDYLEKRILRFQEDQKKADDTFQLFFSKLEEGKKRLEGLQNEDKMIEKMFKKEISSLSAQGLSEHFNQFADKSNKDTATNDDNTLNPYYKTKEEEKVCSKQLQCPQEIPLDIWARFLDLRQMKVSKMAEITELNQKLASMEAEVNALRTNQTIIQTNIEKCAESKRQLLNQIHDYRFDTLLYYRLRQGQVEINENELVKDMRECIMIDRSVVEDFNKKVIGASHEQIQVLNEIKLFRRGINVLNWQAKLLELEQQYWSLLTSEYQLRRVTKKDQEIVKVGGHESKLKSELATLQRKLEFTKTVFEEKLREQKLQLKKLQKKTEDTIIENAQLDQKIENLQRELFEKQEICNIQGVDSLEQEQRKKLNTQMGAIVTRRKLTDLIKMQTGEIQHLKLIQISLSLSSKKSLINILEKLLLNHKEFFPTLTFYLFDFHRFITAQRKIQYLC
ncbi:hypothetical protein RFI_30804 [Reticulomyxa filosa]|uniref:Cilia- and flagella-associated protein 43 n=1 Tax=Reticulomyxa filosa TaxID=46433 RepID=X6LYZ7_RETFI|nr:hypothetical protein RFI_30804 [Reticulomyxa filosa]|eukprot:ETO06586.1 hypothetical protein RFI_30804 [Reticulomyxa filosa]